MAPSLEHERRRELLDSLALLAGCSQRVATLPDGTVPDVLRWRPSDGLILVGEAKATETAGCASTRGRLRGYLGWAAHSGRNHGALVAVCHDHAGDTWRTVLAGLCDSSGLPDPTSGCLALGERDALSWVVVGSRARESGFWPERLDEWHDGLYRRARWRELGVGATSSV